MCNVKSSLLLVHSVNGFYKAEDIKESVLLPTVIKVEELGYGVHHLVNNHHVYHTVLIYQDGVNGHHRLINLLQTALAQTPQVRKKYKDTGKWPELFPNKEFGMCGLEHDMFGRVTDFEILLRPGSYYDTGLIDDLGGWQGLRDDIQQYMWYVYGSALLSSYRAELSDTYRCLDTTTNAMMRMLDRPELYNSIFGGEVQKHLVEHFTSRLRGNVADKSWQGNLQAECIAAVAHPDLTVAEIQKRATRSYFQKVMGEIGHQIDGLYNMIDQLDTVWRQDWIRLTNKHASPTTKWDRLHKYFDVIFKSGELAAQMRQKDYIQKLKAQKEAETV